MNYCCPDVSGKCRMILNMKIALTSVVIQLTLSFGAFSQNYLDSAIALRNTEIISGKVPTYYTPGYREVALDLQKTITEAINYYEKKYSMQFQIKLAALDSVQLLKEYLPYGYVFYDKGWIGMNTGMRYDSFKKVYGLENIYQHLDQQLEKESIKSSEIITSFYKVYAIHELGHYFNTGLSNSRSPDLWTNEFIATYFAYEFFQGYDPTELRNFELFHGVHKDFYTPKYSSIKDFNEIYARMGVENYLWYHSNFYFLVKSLYSCSGNDFLSVYEDLFPKGSELKLTTDEIINLLDKDCSGIVKSWVEDLENKTKN